MFTKIQICSDASVQVGGNPIQSFTEETAEAIIAKSMYDRIYGTLLSHRDWTFARRYFKPIRADKVSTSGYRYVYILPNEVLKVIAIKDNPDTPFQLIGKREIHINTEISELLAIVRPDEEDLPDDFVEALVNFLSFKFAVPIAEDSTKAGIYKEQSDDAIRRAVDNDLAQEPPEPWVGSDVYTDSFYGGMFR